MSEHSHHPGALDTPLIYWLGQAECHNRTLVGGKAANLSRLAATFQVPPGFCLTTAAFECALANGLAIDEVSGTPGVLSNALRNELTNAYTTLAARCGVAAPPVAVRSSAVDEDGASASFAGQYETFLNIVGAEQVAEAIVQCWRSAGSARALAYRSQQGLPSDSLRLAVLVQQLVLADVSAVLFTANPVTGNRDELIINASWGLGESIVGGTVTPDSYVLRASDLAIISQQAAEKRRMTVANAGGTCEVDVPRFLRRQPALSDDQVVELGRLGQALEAAMGRPVDIECAYQSGRLYLLQCRPITAIQRSDDRL
jgi:phosphoenolpyruvate synthase/pyruvate phosphate dikinase